MSPVQRQILGKPKVLPTTGRTTSIMSNVQNDNKRREPFDFQDFRSPSETTFRSYFKSIDKGDSHNRTLDAADLASIEASRFIPGRNSTFNYDSSSNL